MIAHSTINLLTLRELLTQYPNSAYLNERDRRVASGQYAECALCKSSLESSWIGNARYVCEGCEFEISYWGWEEICLAEPKLATLYRAAKEIHFSVLLDAFCANRVWKACFLSQLKELVGTTACNPALCNNHCYDIAYAKIYSALPQCQNCDCR